MPGGERALVAVEHGPCLRVEPEPVVYAADEVFLERTRKRDDLASVGPLQLGGGDRSKRRHPNLVRPHRQIHPQPCSLFVH